MSSPYLGLLFNISPGLSAYSLYFGVCNEPVTVESTSEYLLSLSYISETDKAKGQVLFYICTHAHIPGHEDWKLTLTRMGQRKQFFVCFEFDSLWVHTLQCSVFTPNSEIRNFSWQCWGAKWDTREWIQIGRMQDPLPAVLSPWSSKKTVWDANTWGKRRRAMLVCRKSSDCAQ